MTQPILVIGAGPVGMTLASELKRYGVDVRIVDAAAQRTDKSKAMVLWSRTLELLDRGEQRGSQAFVDAGFKINGVTFTVSDRTVGRVGMDDIPSVHAYALTIPQSETERLLEERLSRLGVRVERGTTATEFRLSADGAQVDLRHPDGSVEAVHTPWLLGCDGAHSAVRHAVGAPFVGESLLSDWFLADVHMTGYPRPDSEASIYWHSEGVLIFFPIKPGRYRIIGDLPATADKTPAAPTLDQVQALVDRRGPSGTKVFDPIWLSGFRINGRKVAQYRYERTFLAGDAAHIHSPAGGQGMNTGMQDAFNLAWKLALVVHGRADESLLDSYSPERSEVGDQVLEAAGRLTTVATLKSSLAQRIRNLAGHIMLGLPRFTHAVADNMSEVAIHYAHSPLNGSHLGHGPRPGTRVAPNPQQPPFGAGPIPKFALLASRSSKLDEVVRSHGDLIESEIRPPIKEGTTALVRPDGYLACTAADPDEINAYLKRIVRAAEVAVPV